MTLPTDLARLEASHRRCRRCVDAGLLPEARPVLSVRPGQRILVVGQAPGPVEHDVGRPFAGRAGAQLMRWLRRAGFQDEADARERVAFVSMTTCFPGRRPGGGGDRVPSPREIALCEPWRLAVIDLLRPRLVLPVGALAAAWLLPGRRLTELVGRTLDPAGSTVDGDPGARPRVLLPLPHPSGQSRWLNHPEQAALLDAALVRLGELVDWAEGPERRRERVV